MKKKYLIPLTVLIVCCVLFIFFGIRIDFSSASAPVLARNIALVVNADEINLLDGFKILKSADLSGSKCYEEIMLWQQANPEVSVKYTVELAEGLNIGNDENNLEIPADFIEKAALSDAAEKLRYLPELKSISFEDEKSIDNLKILAVFLNVRPELQYNYEFKIAGNVMDLKAEALDLRGWENPYVKILSKALPAMVNLKTVELGSDEENPELKFDAIAKLTAARPDIKFNYKFSIDGREFSLMDRKLDLNHIKMDDEGKLVREIIPCMPRLEFLDMDSCNVSDEAMASIRDDFPDVKVVWRIWFGGAYSVRTDVEKILASRPSKGGAITPENSESLKYCTEVKYLDMGHNPEMRDISFVSYMPKLKVVLLPMAYWSDASPLENCPDIEYLEIQTTYCNDISALKNMKNLKHLNICYLPYLHDISPLYELRNLERLWIGYIDPIPREQIDKIQENCPDCEINTTTYDPTEEGWRYLDRFKYGTEKLHPRYAELRKTFHYELEDRAFSFAWNDPLY